MIKYGKLTVKIDNKIIKELNIFVKNDIRKKEVSDYFKELLFSFENMFKEKYWKEIY